MLRLRGRLVYSALRRDPDTERTFDFFNVSKSDVFNFLIVVLAPNLIFPDLLDVLFIEGTLKRDVQLTSLFRLINFNLLKGHSVRRSA